MIDLSQLNSQQFEAVTQIRGPVMIIPATEDNVPSPIAQRISSSIESPPTAFAAIAAISGFPANSDAGTAETTTALSERYRTVTRIVPSHSERGTVTSGSFTSEAI